MQAPSIKGSPYGFLSPLRLAGRGGTSERVRTILRDAIVEGDLPPGGDIDKQELCDRLGVSRFPVSEALARLQGEGLVEILPQRGTRVARIRLSDVRQSTFIRRALESEAVRELAGRVEDGLLAAVDRNLRYQEAAIAAEDRRGFHRLDLEFHELLLDALGYVRVKAAVDAARASLDRVRRMLASPRRHAMSYSEHQAIVAALRQRAPAEAARAMEAHVDAVVTELVGFAGDHPEIFEDL
jgi:GntR family transcriptional regulator, rspAB operon transcriptional repressor